MDGETILFVGAHFEIKNGNQITKYYMAGSTRIAMRKYTAPEPMTVEYMLSDHLGSTSLTADADGNKVLEIRYKAWGEVRATWTNVPVDIDPAYKMPLYTYTGQAAYLDDPLTSGVTEGFGLMFYNARWYDPYITHFVQADTIVPQEQGTQAWDRYAFVNNNPVRYVDANGHNICLRCVIFAIANAVINPNQATQQVIGIALDWANGSGEEMQEFGPAEPITQEVMHEKQVDQFRDEWKESGYQTPFSTVTTVDKRDGSIGGIITSAIGFTKAQLDLGASLLGFGGNDPSGTHDALEGTLGSFDSISAQETTVDGVVKIVATNSAGLASFTRVPGTNFSFMQNIARGEGWGGTIYQEFYWYVRVPWHTKLPDGK